MAMRDEESWWDTSKKKVEASKSFLFVGKRSEGFFATHFDRFDDKFTFRLIKLKFLARKGFISIAEIYLELNYNNLFNLNRICWKSWKHEILENKSKNKIKTDPWSLSLLTFPLWH